MAVKVGSPCGDVGIVWPSVVIEVKVDGDNGAGGGVDRRNSPLADKRWQYGGGELKRGVMRDKRGQLRWR